LDLKGSHGKAQAVAFSPDQQRVATGWTDGFIRLWDLGDGKLLTTLTGHASGLNRFEFSQDGSQLYSADYSGVLKAWDLTVSPDVVEFSEPTDNPTTAISADGRFGAFIIKQNTVLVRDLTLNLDIAEWSEAPQDILHIAFSPDGGRLASAGSDGMVRLRNFTTLAEVMMLAGHSGPVNHFEFSPDGQSLASAGDDRTTRIWNLERPQECLSLNGHNHNVMKVAFNFRGDRLATYSYDGTVRLWDATDGRELRKFTWEYPVGRNHFWLLQFSPNGSQLASTHGKHLRIWVCATGSEITHVEETNPILAIEFSPDGHRLAYGGWFPAMHIWDIANQREVAKSVGEFTELKFHADGSRLVAACEDQTIRIWDTESGKMLKELGQPRGGQFKDWICAIAISPNGNSLAGADMAGQIQIWNSISK